MTDTRTTRPAIDRKAVKREHDEAERRMTPAEVRQLKLECGVPVIINNWGDRCI
jgi:hypothetical protein